MFDLLKFVKFLVNYINILYVYTLNMYKFIKFER